jgi:hypothetical protein
MNKSIDRATAFWNAFSRISAELAILFFAKKHKEVFDAIESLMSSHNYDYCYDITAANDRCQLIFSPEGDKILSAEIESFVKVAPFYDDWQVLDSRQRKSQTDVRALLKHLYLIDINFCRFTVRRSIDCVYITILVFEESDMSFEEMQSFANTFSWHAIGEKSTIEYSICVEALQSQNDIYGSISADSFFNECVDSILLT